MPTTTAARRYAPPHNADLSDLFARSLCVATWCCDKVVTPEAFGFTAGDDVWVYQKSDAGFWRFAVLSHR